MIIQWKMRPAGLRSTVSTKKLYQMMGYESIPSATEIIMNLELTAQAKAEGLFLKELAAGLVLNKGSRVAIFDAEGKMVAERICSGLRGSDDDCEEPVEKS